jgi:FMN phosphatase YigB (HAD superfamily)
MKELMNQAIELGLFDSDWYQDQHKLYFASPLEAFNDYLRKSPYSEISPSPLFDTISYYENNLDVYELGISPLEHYLNFGRHEGRNCFPLRPLWKPKADMNNLCGSFSRKGRYAIVLHIFYVDFVQRFNDAISGVDFVFDLFITTTNQDVMDIAPQIFTSNDRIGEINIKKVPNHGRNFGPFLVEFGAQLLDYDFFCHLHSKKSLYSGKEQVQWANYLIEYLIKDKQVLSRALNILESNLKYGLYYPTSFWNLPTWVNHWLKNKHLAKDCLKNQYGIEKEENDFFAYPVGGMFWARTDALKPILERTWSYDDFPQEPLPADGSFLHVLERIIPKIANKQGYDQFFYNPSTGQFTDDDSYVFRSYLFGNLLRLKNTTEKINIVSFDIFDTLVKRDFYEPDYAKYLMPSRLGLDFTSEEFVKIRNTVEYDLRVKKQFIGDVDIYEIYEELVLKFNLSYEPKQLAETEFEIDLEGLNKKEIMIDLLNALAEKGKRIFIISDTYYMEHQIRMLLSKVGVRCNYELFLSSTLGLRKDNGSMWEMLDKHLTEQNQKINCIHIGDNVCSDSQFPGDYGINNFHILGPMDKWDAMGFPTIRETFSIKNIDMVLKWGQLLSQVNSSPFI